MKKNKHVQAFEGKAAREGVGPLESFIRLFRLSEAPIPGILDSALEETLSLTNSAVGYIYFYNETTELFTLYSWSKDVMQSCTTVQKQTTYELEKTGLWGEVVRGRRPILVNDYHAPHPQKKGYPEGHVRLKNFLSIPIFQGGSIVAVVGVGNKQGGYAQGDIDLLELYFQGVWALVARKQAEEKLSVDRELTRFKSITNAFAIPVCFIGHDGQYEWCNDACLKYLGVQIDDILKKTPHDIFESKYAEKIEKHRLAVLEGRPVLPLVVEIVARGGDRRTVIITTSVYRDSAGAILGLFETRTDITEVKRFEKALAEAFDFNTTILELAPVGIAVYNATTGKCVLANTFLAELVGGSVGAQNQQNFRELATWKQSGRLELAERALASGAIVKADKQYRSSFGKEVFLECTFASITAGGEPYLLRVDKDISERKRMETELNDQLVFVRTLADAISSPVYFKDTCGRYVWSNKAYKELRGGEDLSGKTVHDLLEPDAAAFHGEMEKEMYERNKPISYEYETFTNTGERREVLFHKAPFIDSEGHVKGVVSVMSDITDKNRAEKELRQSEEILKTILLEIKAGIIIIDPGTFTIVDVNTVAEGILGTPRDALVGKPCNHIRWVRERDGQTGETGPLFMGSMVNEEFRIERPDGSIVPVLKTMISANRSGQLFFYEIFFDMTARKALERQLVLAQRLESIGGLAAGIAHEINTPIQYVGDNLSFLEDAFASLILAAQGPAEHGAGNSGGMDMDFILEEVPKALTQSREGVARVAGIVGAMKRFSHPGGEEKSLLDVPKAIENTVLVARNEWKYHAEVRLDLDPLAAFLLCFPGDFNQVLLNILVNASHAINDKYMDCEHKGVITISTRLDGESFVLSVSDTGCGIPEKNLHRVFDQFFTTKAVGKGTGQGLALVHDVMRKHGGSVEVESALGQGTTFILRFPSPREEGGTA